MSERKVILKLDLPYKLKAGEETQFLDPELGEVEKLQAAVDDTLTTVGASATPEKRALAVTEARRRFVESLSTPLNPRVTSFLLRQAVDLRYRKDLGGGRTEVAIPRKEADKRQPGRWWGEILDEIDLFPAEIVLTVDRAMWLRDVWTHDSVQNGWAPALQRWINVLDDEFERLGKLERLVEERASEA